MRLVDACRPDWYESLCDSDTPRSASLKRVRRAVDRTIAYLDRCIDAQTGLTVSSLCVCVIHFTILLIVTGLVLILPLITAL